MRVTRYDPSQMGVWDEFIRESKNGVFLFWRDYMDYHSDRFQDHSLMIWDDKDKLLAVLPAHEEGELLGSHHGLTYGGFITDGGMKALKMVAVFLETLRYTRERGFRVFTYRTAPHIYHQVPAQEDLYALLLARAELDSRVVISALPAKGRLPFQELRRRGGMKARKRGIEVRASSDFASFWRILEEVLRSSYGAKPVHSLKEIERLHEKFPGNIQLHAAYIGEQMVAGVVIYESKQVARAQYIAASDAGKECAALDLIFEVLLNQTYPRKPYFEFGTSQLPDSDNLSPGLIAQKEGFGARTVVYDYYRLDLNQWRPDALESALNA